MIIMGVDSLADLYILLQPGLADIMTIHCNMSGHVNMSIRLDRFDKLSKPPDFFSHIQRELHCNNLPIQQLSRKQHIFGKTDDSLLLGINYCWR